MKICSKCGQNKYEYEFYKLKNNKLWSYCKKCNSICRKKYEIKNREKILQNKRKYYLLHKNDKASYDVIYRKKNKEKIAKYKKEWEIRNKDNPIFKIKRNLRRRIHHVIKDNCKSAHTFELIGCTAEEFKLYIEKQFINGMSWDNYGPLGWHIDHIIPCYKFDLSKLEEQRKCFHYTNQRPLWYKDNLSRPRI